MAAGFPWWFLFALASPPHAASFPGVGQARPCPLSRAHARPHLVSTHAVCTARRIRGGADASLGHQAPRANKAPRRTPTRAEELIACLATHAWATQPWHGRAALVGAVVCMGASKLFRVRSTFALACALEAAGNVANAPASGGGASAGGDMAWAASATATAAVQQLPLLLTPAARALAAYVAYRLASDACVEMKRALFAPVGQHAVKSLAAAAFAKAHARGSAWHVARPAGGLDRVFHRGARALQTLLNAVTFNLAPTVFEAVLVLSVLWRQFGPCVSGAAACTLASSIATGVVINERRRHAHAEANRRDNALSSRFVESLRAHELVKLSSAEATEVRTYNILAERLLALRVNLALSLAALNGSQRAAFAVGLLAVLLLALRDVRSGAVAASKLVVLHGLMRHLASPVQQLGASFTIARQACIDLGGLIELTRPLGDAAGAEDLQRVPLPALPPVRGGSLELKGVTVEADNSLASISDAGVGAGQAARTAAGAGALRVLDGVTFTVRPGELVAIVGPSGAGKSTLVRCIAQLQQVDGGTVRLGGHDLARFDARSVRAQLSAVPQDCTASAMLVDEGGVDAGGGMRGHRVPGEPSMSCALADAEVEADEVGDAESGEDAEREMEAVAGEDVEREMKADEDANGDEVVGASADADADLGADGDSDTDAGADEATGADADADANAETGWWLRAVRYAAPDAPTDRVLHVLASLGLPPGLRLEEADAAAGDAGSDTGGPPEARRTAGDRGVAAAEPSAHGELAEGQGQRLSGGELQRLAVARALARNAACIICDEPTANLDPLRAAAVVRALRDAATRAPVLVVTHDLRLVGPVADRVVVLRQGKVIEEGGHAALVRAGGVYARLWDAAAFAGDDRTGAGLDSEIRMWESDGTDGVRR